MPKERWRFRHKEFQNALYLCISSKESFKIYAYLVRNLSKMMSLGCYMVALRYISKLGRTNLMFRCKSLLVCLGIFS